MTDILIYVYRPGRDFEPPASLGARQIPFLSDLHVSCDGFYEVENPEAADYFLFPYFLENLTEYLKITGLFNFIHTLPYVNGRENRHVFFSNHDSSAPYFSRFIWFRASLNRLERDPYSYAIPYLVSNLSNTNSQDLSSLKFHTSFVGYVGFCGERLPLLEAIKNEERLVSFIDPVGGFYSYLDEKRKKLQREKFVDALFSSMTVLCPRGDGENSIRFFETLSAGRIPVLVSNALLPLEELINYSEFVIKIDDLDVSRAGNVLYESLKGKSDEELLLMCATARTIWEKHLSPPSFSKLVYKHLRDHMHSAVSSAGYWRQADIPFALKCAEHAREKMRNFDFVGAEQLFIKAIEWNPIDSVLYNDLGVSQFQQGKLMESEKSFKFALRYDHRLYWAHVNLGDVLSLSGDFDGAVASYKRAYALDSSNELPRIRAEKILRQEGKWGHIVSSDGF